MQVGAPRFVGGEPALLIAEQHEPSDRHVPRTLMAERHGGGVVSPEASQVSGGPPGFLLGNELFPQLHRLGLAERQHRGEDPQAQTHRAQVRAAVHDADLGVLGPEGRQQPQRPHRSMVGVARAERLRGGTIEQVSLPMELFLALERIERLEHPEERAGHHRPELTAGRHPLCSRRPTRGP